jgi:hypothetical protein
MRWLARVPVTSLRLRNSRSWWDPADCACQSARPARRPSRASAATGTGSTVGWAWPACRVAATVAGRWRRLLSIARRGWPLSSRSAMRYSPGTANGIGALRVRMGRLPHDSVVARIVTMVEQASATKAKTQLFEKTEQLYSIGMVNHVALFAVPVLFGVALQATLPRDDLHDRRIAVRGSAGYDAAAAVGDGRRRASRCAGHIRGGWKQLGQVTPVAFDKTGTLIEGAPRVADIRVLP